MKQCSKVRHYFTVWGTPGHFMPCGAVIACQRETKNVCALSFYDQLCVCVCQSILLK